MFDEKDWKTFKILKFICVFCMIFFHAHVVMVTDGYSIVNPDIFLIKLTYKMGLFGTFITSLPIMGGMIFRISLKDNLNPNLFKIIQMAIYLSIIGFFMNMITWGTSYTFGWNVLQFTGLSFIIMAILLKYISLYSIPILGLITLLAAGPLRNLLSDYESIYFVSIFTGANNHFIFWPLFPWFAVIAFGFILGHCYLKLKNIRIFYLGIFIIGLSFILIGIIRNEMVVTIFDQNYFWGDPLMRPPMGVIITNMGFFSLTLVIVNLLFKNLKLYKYGIINCYSKGILWIYVTQMFVGYKLSLILDDFLIPLKYENPGILGLSLYLGFILFLMLICWLVGFVYIKLFYESQFKIVFKKVK